MNQEHAFCLAIEKLLGIAVPKRGQLIRVLYCEIGRLLSHVLNVTTQAMDVGALTPILWGFEEREKLMVFYERDTFRKWLSERGCHFDTPGHRRGEGHGHLTIHLEGRITELPSPLPVMSENKTSTNECWR
jgi:hypothetical protein